MKRFWCGAVIPNCRAQFEGEGEQDILRQVAAHAAQDHGLREVPSSMIDRVREAITDEG